MNVNAEKLREALEKSDTRSLKRIAVIRGAIPRTTIENHKRGQVPLLRHAVAYEDVFKFACRDWLIAAKVGT
jgi:hypothetical protein